MHSAGNYDDKKPFKRHKLAFRLSLAWQVISFEKRNPFFTVCRAGTQKSVYETIKETNDKTRPEFNRGSQLKGYQDEN